VNKTADRYRRWFAYERDSHAKVLAALESVPEAGRSSHSFQKALELMAHLVAARRVWLFRMGAARERPSELFPQGVRLTELIESLGQTESAWADYLEGLDDAALSKNFEYQSTEGDWYRNSVEDILTQLFGHSWYHRGQIATLVRSAGGEPAVTDFVFWAREPIPAPGQT
jgi:uncharacterized damage-inducible protein DinB